MIATIADELLARAAALGPEIAERAAAAEAERRIPQATIAALRAAGLFAASQPARYGGHEIGLDELMPIIIEIARHCGSTGWVYGVFCDHAMCLGMFAAQAQDEVWGKSPLALASSGLAPAGETRAVSGGFRVNGRWGFSSGCDHVDWVFVHSFVAASAAEAHYFLVPMREIRILDTWDVMGLSGTGSKDVVLDDVFVPAHRALRVDDACEGRGPGAAVNPNPIFRLPRLATVPFCLVAPAIGIAQALYDRFVAEMSRRSARGLSLAEQPTIQLRVAEAAAEIDAARLLLMRDCAETMRAMRERGALTLAQRARNRRDMAYIVALCNRAAERLFTATGGAGIYRANATQRMFRDLRAAAAHYINVWDIAGQTFGRVTLGLPPNHPAI